MENKKGIRRSRIEAVIFIILFFAFFGYLAYQMTLPHMLNTIMQTSYKLLLDTVFYLMGITVLMGALGKMLAEFGVVKLVEGILRPLMRPLYNLPGVAALGAVLTFLSDNPAIITLSKDKNFSSYFKKHQLISLTNFGTAFGMGLVVLAFMAGQGFAQGAFIGLIGSVAGSVVSTRLMQRYILKENPEFAKEVVAHEAVVDESVAKVSGEDAEKEDAAEGYNDNVGCNEKREEPRSLFTRILDSILDGGKSGVEIGLAIIPGVLIISTFVMVLTFGPSATGEYTGSAYEGVAILPYLADKVNFVFEWLFGFTHPELVAFPITSLGAVGAALGLVPRFAAEGLIDNNAIAVFTAMGMCWSGFLSTHTAMLDSLGFRKFTPKAILAHTIGGLVAGIVAHWAYVAIMAIF